MYYNFLVPVPVKAKVVRQTKNGVTYIDYEHSRVYDKDKKYTRPKRSTIGKQSPTDPTMMWPNENYSKFFSDDRLTDILEKDKRSCCLRIGGYAVINQILEQTKIPELLKPYFKEGNLGLLLDMVAYSILTENNAGQYYPDYAFSHPLYTKDMKLYSDTTVSDFLHNVTADQRIGFLNEWNEKKDHREKIYISYDATNKNCQAGDIDFAEYGHAKDDESKPVVNYSVAYDTNNREPLFYEEYPGSINDISQLRYTVSKAQGYGYRHIGFILDRGYFNNKSFEYMDECGYSFVIMMKGCKAVVKELIRQVKGSFEKKRKYFMQDEGLAGITIKRKLYESDKKERYFHLFYSISRESKERSDFEEELKKMAEAMQRQEGREFIFPKSYEEYYSLYYHEEKEKVQVIKEGSRKKEEREIVKKVTFLFGREKEEIIEAAIDMFGYFVIITSDEMTAEQALRLYNSRDTSEKLFRADKSFLENHSLRVHSNESVANKIFIGFLALIVRNRVYNALQDEIKRLGTKPNYMTVPAALRELEKIEMVRSTDNIYRLDHAITRTQKAILKAFNMDEYSIEQRANKIQSELRRVMKKGAQDLMLPEKHRLTERENNDEK